MTKHCSHYVCIAEPPFSIIQNSRARSPGVMVAQNGDDGSERTSQSDGGSLRAECLHDKYAYITHIRLSGPQSPRPSAVELVSMLEQSLQLEVFSLSNMDVAVPGVQMGGPAIRLPDIKTFEL